MNRVCLIAAGVGVFLGAAYAAKVCEQVDAVFPGVDDGGLLSMDVGLAGELRCQFCVKTNNGKARIKCEGTVDNESGENQKFKNDPFIAETVVGVMIATKSLYKVKAQGGANLTVKGTAIPEN